MAIGTVDIEVREVENKLRALPLLGLTVVVAMIATIMTKLADVVLLVTIPGTPLEHLPPQRYRLPLGILLKDRGRMNGREMIAVDGGLEINMEIAGSALVAAHRPTLVMKLRMAKHVVHVHRSLGLIDPPPIIPFAVAARTRVSSVTDRQQLLMLAIARQVKSIDADQGNMIDVEC